jgi:hypothetical protein
MDIVEIEDPELAARPSRDDSEEDGCPLTIAGEGSLCGRGGHTGEIEGDRELMSIRRGGIGMVIAAGRIPVPVPAPTAASALVMVTTPVPAPPDL